MNFPITSFLRRAFAAGTLVLSFALAAAPVAAAEGNAEAGAIKAAQCSGCHGIPGWRNAYPAYRVPKLGGQHPAYIIAALQAYKNGTREHSTMHAIAVGLSDQDMADLAAFFGSQQ